MQQRNVNPGLPTRWRGHVPMAPEGAVVDGAAAKAEPAPAAPVTAPAEPAKPEAKVEIKAAPAAPEAKVEAVKVPDYAPAPPDEVIKRVEAIEKRTAKQARDATLAYLAAPELGCLLTREQLALQAPDFDVSTVEGRAAADQWRTKNANLFRPSDPRPDQIAGDLAAKYATTYKDNPELAARAARLTKSVFR